MRRLFILVAGVALAGAACSSTQTMPLTRGSGTGVQTVDAPTQSGRPVTLGPLDVRLTPDVLVRTDAPIDPVLGQKLTGLVNAGHANLFRTATLTLTGPNGAGPVNVAGVD